MYMFMTILRVLKTGSHPHFPSTKFDQIPFYQVLFFPVFNFSSLVGGWLPGDMETVYYDLLHPPLPVCFGLFSVHFTNLFAFLLKFCTRLKEI